MRSKQYQIETKNENPTAEDQADIGAAVRTTNDDKMLQILPLRKVFCPFQMIKILTLREIFLSSTNDIYRNRSNPYLTRKVTTFVKLHHMRIAKILTLRELFQAAQRMFKIVKILTLRDLVCTKN